ncbi:MAG: 2-phospho-L-lactate transferase [Actinobacteria bacterium]|nr:2-phospho-L-lactate transferase [Actinomycetota bacterium]
MICVLAGGVGAAKFLSGLVRAVPASEVTAVVNVGDDLDLHGLRVCPDLDTVTYTLAGAVNPETGWGRAHETWNVMEGMERFGASTWFRLGDRDIATHLYRTERLRAGAGLAEVTAEIARAWGLRLHLVPATEDELRTMVTVAEGAERHEVSFQEYFVQRRHSVPVASIRFAGAETAYPAPCVLEAVVRSEAVVIAPSNPVVSIDPILAVQGLREAVGARRERVVAVSPIIGGAALKGPADRLLRELGHESSAVGVAHWYAPIAGTLVIDEVDADLAPAVEAAGMRCIVAPAVMSDPGRAEALARVVLAAAGAPVDAAAAERAPRG